MNGQWGCEVRLRCQPCFGLARPHDGRGDRTESHADGAAEGVVHHADRGSRDDHCVARSHLGVALEPVENRQGDGHDHLVGLARVLLYPEHEFMDRQIAGCIQTLEVHGGIECGKDR